MYSTWITKIVPLHLRKFFAQYCVHVLQNRNLNLQPQIEISKLTFTTIFFNGKLRRNHSLIHKIHDFFILSLRKRSHVRNLSVIAISSMNKKVH